jgi:hypothetical protein
LPKKPAAELSDPYQDPRSVPHALDRTPLGNIPSAFETPHLGLLVAEGTANGTPCKVLFDAGAQINYIAAAFTKKHRIATHDTAFAALMIDGHAQKVQHTLNPVNLCISSYHEPLHFAVCPMNSYDIILGKQWLSQYDPRISHSRNKLDFDFGGKRVHISATLETSTPLISLNTMARAVRTGAEVFAVLVQTSPDEEQTHSSDVRGILSEFSDVFPKDLPAGLPPQRAQDFHIDLVPGTLPIKRGLYRLSEKE